MTIGELKTIIASMDDNLEVVMVMAHGTNITLYEITGQGLTLGLNEAHFGLYTDSGKWIITR